MEPPVNRYELTITIEANSLYELEDKLNYTAINFPMEHQGQEMIRYSSDQVTLRLTDVNPEMTPERYTQELQEWRARRRQSRDGGQA